jgi:hypothetical protein
MVAVIACAAFLIIQAMYCSSPLTTEDVTGEHDVDTLVILLGDTIFVLDTIYTPADTIIMPGETLYVPLDTIILPGDTIFFPLDTVYMPGDTIYMPPDTVEVHDTVLQYCGHLESTVQQIVWPIMNEPGRYVLEFAAVLESDRPEQALDINIGGQVYQWSLIETLEFMFDGTLGADVIVRIISQVPPARGHSIDICMRIRRL